MVLSFLFIFLIVGIGLVVLVFKILRYLFIMFDKFVILVFNEFVLGLKLSVVEVFVFLIDWLCFLIIVLVVEFWV